MTIREKMQQDGGNLGWCKPLTITTEDGTEYTISVNDGELCSVNINGIDTQIDVKTLAQRVNPCYDDYSGWTDMHILLDVGWKELDCCDCPWFDMCDAMDGDCDD